jgi:hypothetical protein
VVRETVTELKVEHSSGLAKAKSSDLIRLISAGQKLDNNKKLAGTRCLHPSACFVAQRVVCGWVDYKEFMAGGSAVIHVPRVVVDPVTSGSQRPSPPPLWFVAHRSRSVVDDSQK